MFPAQTTSVLARSALLGGLPAETLARLGAVARRRAYRRGQVVFHQGDPGETMQVIDSGRAKVFVYAASRDETLLDILGPGDCFGELTLLDGDPRSATVEALEPLQTVEVRRDEFLEVIYTNRAAMERLLAAMATKIRVLSDIASDLAFLDLEGRLAKKLLDLAAEHGRHVAGETLIDLPITQDDLAAMIGCTRASVSKLLRLYEASGAIQRRGRRIAIPNPERLSQRVD